MMRPEISSAFGGTADRIGFADAPCLMLELLPPPLVSFLKLRGVGFLKLRGVDFLKLLGISFLKPLGVGQLPVVQARVVGSVARVAKVKLVGEAAYMARL
jgi:hypothetical protein